MGALWQPVQADFYNLSFGLVLEGGRLAPFYIHQMNRMNLGNGSDMMTES